MVLSGDAHISSIVDAYDVPTETSNSRPVVAFNASLRRSPPAMISSALTDGTNRTWIGLSVVPIVGAGAAVVVAGASVVVGAAVVGAAVVSVAAGSVVSEESSLSPQAATNSANTASNANILRTVIANALPLDSPCVFHSLTAQL